MSETSKGAALIAKERESQRQEYSDEHDDRHGGGQIALAAALLATPILLRSAYWAANTVTFRDPYPWPYSSRPHDGNVVLPNEVLERPARIRQLVKAGALVAAEIDRLLRLEAREEARAFLDRPARQPASGMEESIDLRKVSKITIEVSATGYRLICWGEETPEGSLARLAVREVVRHARLDGGVAFSVVQSKGCDGAVVVSESRLDEPSLADLFAETLDPRVDAASFFDAIDAIEQECPCLVMELMELLAEREKEQIGRRIESEHSA